MTAWTLHTDPNGDRCLFHGDTAVIRPADLGPHVPPGYRQALFDLLAAVPVQDEETVDRVARVLASFEYEAFSETVANAYRQRAREILDALAPDVPAPGPSPALPQDDCGNDCHGPKGHAEGCPVHCGCYDPPDRRDPVAHVADAVGRVLPDRTARRTPPLETRVLYQGDAVRDAVAEDVANAEVSES